MKRGLIDPKNTALIVIDIQNDYCSPIGKLAKRGFTVNHFDKLVGNIILFVDKARNVGIPIFFTRMIEDPNYMADNAKIKMRSIKSLALCTPHTFGFEYYKIKPKRNDFQITKKSYDAFSNPMLERKLRKKKIRNVIIVGAYSQVCVDTTIRSAFTRGYNIIVPHDLVSTLKERKNEEKLVINIWKNYFAHVVSSKDIFKMRRDY